LISIILKQPYYVTEIKRDNNMVGISGREINNG